MHHSAMEYGRIFFSTYLNDAKGKKIVDIGAQDVNGSLRSVAPPGNEYIGVDFVAGKGVDVIITDPYNLPFDDNSVDAVVCSSCFEHSEFFWLLFNDIVRILKPGGLFYLNVPSNGNFHRYPVDCWRFYPDSGVALQNWARRSGFDVMLVESFVGKQNRAIWNDYISVFLKDISHLDTYKNRMLAADHKYYNGISVNNDGVSEYNIKTEDQGQPIISFVMKRINEKYNAFLHRFFS